MSLKSILFKEIKQNLDQAYIELTTYQPGSACRYLKAFFNGLEFPEPEHKECKEP